MESFELLCGHCGKTRGEHYGGECYYTESGLRFIAAKAVPPAPVPHVANCGCPECRTKHAPTRATTLPADASERKKCPVASGVLDYFPDAIVAVARVSYEGNQQHNPGQPLHWARGKSMDQDDTLLRHFLERGGFDTDGQRHSAKLAWRALAILQLEIEADARKTV